ncbi:MAG TPA: ABC transporter permease [Gemmatimonadaceae bacterium]|jgi:putative ABC transport system permease protein
MIDRLRRYRRFFGANVDEDIDDELRLHLDLRAADYVARGLDPTKSLRAARERLGDLDAIAAQLRDHDRHAERTERRRDLMDDLWQDVRYALRSLKRAPAFAIVAVLTLALGIGANTAVFSIVDAVVIRALPYPRAEQLTSLDGSTLAEWARIGELSRSFSSVATYRDASVGIAGSATSASASADPERVDASNVSANLFSTLGVRPELGRTFVAGENAARSSNVVVLSHGFWVRRFAADSNIIHQTVTIEGAPYRVVGVMPEEFAFPSHDIKVWLPITVPDSRGGMFWGDGGYQVIGRLRNGVSAAAAQQEIRQLYSKIRLENPIWTPGPEYMVRARVKPLQERLVGTARTTLFLLLAVVGVVLLMACANVANLLLVRATARTREVAIRMALGGGRLRLLRQLLTESVVLALLGGACGVLLAWLGIHGLLATLPSDIPHVADVGIDGRVLAFTTSLTVLTGVLFGLLPAMRASRTDVQRVLRSGTRTAGSTHQRVATLLVCGQIGAAVLLVTSAALLVRSMWALHTVDPGFRTASVVTARLSPPKTEFSDPTTIEPLVDELLRHVRALPGVQDAGAVNQLPMSGTVGKLAMRIAGQFEDMKQGTLPWADHYQFITPSYLSTMGIPIVAGRGFAATDIAKSPPVAVVSASFARHFWPHGNAVGQRIGNPWPSDWITIVGVTKDARLDSLNGTSQEAVYRPFAQVAPTSIFIVARTTSDPAALAASLRAAVAQTAPDTPVSDVERMAAVVDRSSARQRFTMVLLSLFAAIALLLGVVGVYGVMSYSVAQRTREIGVRMALGATPLDAMRLVLRDGARLAMWGVIAGVLVAALSTRALGSLLYGVTANDPVTFVSVALALGGIALLASYLPARRATRVDPTRALRAE